MRARIKLIDDSQLDFSEYFQPSPDGTIQVVTYSYYNWTDSRDTLILRWDNTPHYPDLPRFPDHIHDGGTGAIKPGSPASIFAVLDEIADKLAF